jgi:hypothetical protein
MQQISFAKTLEKVIFESPIDGFLDSSLSREMVWLPRGLLFEIFQSPMPLYTYIVNFKSESYVVQGRSSNFTVFFDALTRDVPIRLFPHLVSALKSDSCREIVYGQFIEVPNRRNVWCKKIDVDGSVLTVYVVQTTP